MLAFCSRTATLLLLLALLTTGLVASARRDSPKANIIRDISDLKFAHNKHTAKDSGPVDSGTQNGNNRPKPEVLVMPPRIDFKPTQLFVPLTQHIDVLNPSIKDTVQIQSITSRNIHFQVSVFQQTALLPLSRIRIPIVFLPRKLGPKEGKIIVGTSVGNVKVRVSGTGQPNIYGVKDFSGLHIPVDTRINPPIQIYNPYDRIFHVKEVFTTENFLHLSLPKSHIPNQKPDGTKLWQIEPRQSKYIINLSFMSPTPGLFQGYVHIKTEEHNMILPIEIKVVPEALEALDAKIKFGVLTRQNELVQRPLILRNLGTRNISISALRPLRSDPRLEIEYEKGVIVPALSTATVANLSYSGKIEANVTGTILVLHSPTSGSGSAKTSRLEVPYTGRVLHGSLAHHPKLGYFPVNVHNAVKRMPVESRFVFDKSNKLREEVRVMEFTNTFSVPVRVRRLYLKNATMLAIASVQSTPYIIEPGQSWSPCSISFTPEHPLTIEFDELVIVTNATVLRLPLQMYSENLILTSKNLTKSTIYRKSIPKQQVRSSGNRAVLRAVNVGKNGILDFGTLAIGESREHTFILTNPSPTTLSIYDATSTLHSVHVLVVSKSELEPDRVLKSRNEPVHLAQNESAHLLIRVSTKDSIGLFQGSIWVRTSSEEIDTAVVYRTVSGDVDLSIVPAEINGVFPGQLIQSTLYAISTFEEEVRVYSITSKDPRMVITLKSELLEPNKKHAIGSLLFDPARADPSSNYMADLVGDADPRLAFADIAGKTLEWPEIPSVTPADLKAVSHAQAVWKRLRATNAHRIEARLRVAMNVQNKKRITLRGSLMQPSLLQSPTLNFSLVQVNNSKKLYVTVRNPASVPVVVTPVRHEEPVLFRHRVNGTVETKQLADSTFKWSPSMRPRGVVLQPNESRKIGPILFTPTHMGSQKTTFYLRNNLTRLSAITVVGVGGMGELAFMSSRNLRAAKHRRIARKQGYILHEHKLSSSLPTSDPMLLSSIPLTMNVSFLGLTESSGGSLYQSLELMRQHNISGITEALLSSLLSTQFSVLNSGNLPITIRTFMLKQPSDAQPCNTDLCQQEVHGFKMHGCKILPMVLQPSESKSFRLQYKPDYTKFYLQRDLVVETDWGRQEIPLEIQLPEKLLPLVESIETPSLSTTGSKALMLVITLYMMYMLASSFWRELRQEREERTKQALHNAIHEPIGDEETGHSEADTSNPLSSPCTPAQVHNGHMTDLDPAAGSPSEPAAKTGKKGKSKRKGSQARGSPLVKASPSPPEPTSAAPMELSPPAKKSTSKNKTAQRIEKARSFQEQSTRHTDKPELTERPRGSSDPKGAKAKAQEVNSQASDVNVSGSVNEKDKSGLRKRRVAKTVAEEKRETSAPVVAPTPTPTPVPASKPDSKKMPPKQHPGITEVIATAKSTPNTPSRKTDKPRKNKQSIPVPASTSSHTVRSLPSPSLTPDSIEIKPAAESKPGRGSVKGLGATKDSDSSVRSSSRQRPTKPPKRKGGLGLAGNSPSLDALTPTVQVPPLSGQPDPKPQLQKSRTSTPQSSHQASPRIEQTDAKPGASDAASARQNSKAKKKEKKRQKALTQPPGKVPAPKNAPRPAQPPITSVWNSGAKTHSDKDDQPATTTTTTQKQTSKQLQKPAHKSKQSLPHPRAKLQPQQRQQQQSVRKTIEPVVTETRSMELAPANLNASPFSSSPFRTSPDDNPVIGTGRRHSAGNNMLFGATHDLPQLPELRANAPTFQPFQGLYGSANPTSQLPMSPPPVSHNRQPSLEDPFQTVINDSFFDFLDDTPSQTKKMAAPSKPDALSLPSPLMEPQRSHAETFTTSILQHLNTPSPTPPAGQKSLNAGYHSSAVDPFDEPLIPPPRADPSQLGLGSRPDSILWPNFGSNEPRPYPPPQGPQSSQRNTDSPPHSLFKNLFDSIDSDPQQ